MYTDQLDNGSQEDPNSLTPTHRKKIPVLVNPLKIPDKRFSYSQNTSPRHKEDFML